MAIVENDSCAVDAVMVITGCTLGKGNLLLRDFGKPAGTLMSRKSGIGVRICVKPDAVQGIMQTRSLRPSQNQQDLMQQIMDMQRDQFCEIQSIEGDLPTPDRIFNSVTCAFCGEMVSKARARMKDGKLACIPCAEQYTRGW